MTNNVSTFNDAQTAFNNSGWADRFKGDDVDTRAADFIRAECSADHIDDDEFETLMQRFAVEKMGWSQNDF